MKNILIIVASAAVLSLGAFNIGYDYGEAARETIESADSHLTPGNFVLEIPEGRMMEIESRLKTIDERIAALEKEVEWHGESVKAFEGSLRGNSELWRKHEQRHAALDNLIIQWLEERRTTSALVPANEVADEFQETPAIPEEIIPTRRHDPKE